MGFIQGQQSFDSILVTGEVIQGLKAKSHEGLVLKLDFEKAFNTIDWVFLFQLLEQMNFDKQWIKRLSIIFTSTRTSVLVNGVPTKEFSPLRGFRQGDPLSPLLFNLVAEVLYFWLKVKSTKCSEA